jgi:hypothetical protein
MNNTTNRRGVLSMLTQARKEALEYLFEAYSSAQELGEPPREFACQLATLMNFGITESALRWLIHGGFIEHLVETTNKRTRRRFTPGRNNRFVNASCFSLTEAGVDLLRNDCDDGLILPLTKLNLRPNYDVACRMLSFGSQIVKKFKVPAANQELILTSLEELGWPPHIDDPLPKLAGVDQKKRLIDTLYRLNANQKTPLLRFEGDGTGRGLMWSLLRNGQARSDRG